jgi:hypothetical protein
MLVSLPALSALISPHPGVVAIAVARTLFTKLCADGTMPKFGVPVPVDPDQVDAAMRYLVNVKPTKKPTAFSDDLASNISQSVGRKISNGALIAASVTLGLTVRTWYGVQVLAPDALIGVSRRAVCKPVRSAQQRGHAGR